MGVIYKLKPEIKKYILDKKMAKPALSCRGIVGLAEAKFKIKVSKSSINSLFKEAGLSMPVGRRRKKRRGAQKAWGLGAILLKAADYLVGGSYHITEAIKNRLTYQAQNLLAKTEALLYSPLFSNPATPQMKLDYGLWLLVNQGISELPKVADEFGPEGISSYLAELQHVKALDLDIFRVISTVFQEVRCVKVSLLDGTTFYLDGQFHTIWSISHIPYSLSTSIFNIKSYINKYFEKNVPFVLFMAPGYDTPTKEFFDFILSLNAQEKKLAGLTLYGSKLEEIEVFRLEPNKKRGFIFGLWPWQFTEYRKVKAIGEFRPFYFETLKKDFYITEAEIELLQPSANKTVTLRGCALKTTLSEKTRLVILSNLTAEMAPLENLVERYLSRWPNLEEAFQDFSHKIELFTYTAASQRFFSPEDLKFSPSEDIASLLSSYLIALDAFVRWHFFPSEYEEMDFATMKERFYGLSAQVKKQESRFLVTFFPPSEYKFLKDLEYALYRVNESEIIFEDGLRLWCSLP